MFGLKKVKRSINNIDSFISIGDKSLILFKESVRNYISMNKAEFEKNLVDISELQTNSNILRREIELQLYEQEVLVRSKEDILSLVELLDSIVVLIHKVVVEFEIEMPNIPAELNSDFLKLSELSALSADCSFSAAKSYFAVPELITDKIQRIYFYVNEVNKQSQRIKREVFHNMNNLKLSEKFHLRYFTLHIEELSFAAEKLGNHLAIMVIKQKQ